MMYQFDSTRPGIDDEALQQLRLVDQRSRTRSSASVYACVVSCQCRPACTTAASADEGVLDA